MLSIPFVVVCLTLAIRYVLYFVQLRIAKVKQTTTNGIDSTCENQDYTPGRYEWPETGENKYDIAFQANNETEPTVLENARLEVSPDAVGMANIAGTFSLVDYTLPEGESLSWSFQQRKPERAFEIYENGTFCVKGTGTADASGCTEQQATAVRKSWHL